MPVILPAHNTYSLPLCVFLPCLPHEQETVGTGIEALEGLQAQHSILIGDTGQGKSWILNLLLLLTTSDGEYGTAGWQLLRDKLVEGLEAVNDAQASAISTAVETFLMLDWLRLWLVEYMIALKWLLTCNINSVVLRWGGRPW